MMTLNLNLCHYCFCLPEISKNKRFYTLTTTQNNIGQYKSSPNHLKVFCSSSNFMSFLCSVTRSIKDVRHVPLSLEVCTTVTVMVNY